jgi:hypothetical protein
MTHYPRDTKLAKIVLSIDWHAYEDDGDPEEPLIEWTIDTPTSGYHPGKHCGVISLIHLISGLKYCHARVEWKSPIYSPFVRDQGRPKDNITIAGLLNQGQRNGNLKSEGPLEDGLVNFTDLLQSIAHVLNFGPFTPTTETASPPFTFRPEESKIWKHYDKQDAPAKKAFKRAASFFSCAYNQDLPDNSESTGQEDLQHTVDASIVAITGLLYLYRSELLSDEHAADWDVGEALSKAKTKRSLVIEERRWADKVVEACNLEFLKSARKAQTKSQT